MTQDLTKEANLDVSNEGGWATIIEEDFTYGFGLFNHHDNDANHALVWSASPIEKEDTQY